MLRTSLCSFLGGAAVAGGAGYYQLHQDVYRTSAIVQQAVDDATEQLAKQQQVLSARVAALEAKDLVPSGGADAEAISSPPAMKESQ
mmetsp:Transcript_14432/g.38635  ORF Transcript_14432/g.38635 Transcript_14432/m.38635 type:complete len:87 (-) Transcript_14432:1521-1781(-)